MNVKHISSLLVTAFGFVGHAYAQVPSLINYQGRLTDLDGSPISGERGFKISIYDAQENGSVLYSEDIGQVTLDSNGVYSFQFGGSGNSASDVSFIIEATDGVSQSFARELPSQPITGSLSISDGTNTWSQVSGSGNPPAMLGSYDSNTNMVSAIYIQGIPDPGKIITATYKTESTGIAEALAASTEHWMELSIEGVVQQTRQRVLAVPFAAVAGKVLSSASAANTRKEKQVMGWGRVNAEYNRLFAIPTHSDMYGFLDASGFKRLVGIKVNAVHTSSNTASANSRIIFRFEGANKIDMASRTRSSFNESFFADRGIPSTGGNSRYEVLEDYVIPVNLDLQDLDTGLSIQFTWTGSGHSYFFENPIFIFE